MRRVSNNALDVAKIDTRYRIDNWGVRIGDAHTYFHEKSVDVEIEAVIVERMNGNTDLMVSGFVVDTLTYARNVCGKRFATL